MAFIIFYLLLAVSGYAQILDVRELNSTQIQALDREHTVVLLQGAILEEHGPYLPSYSDGYQTEFVAARLAEAIVARPGWTVLRFPVIPLGAMPANTIGKQFTFSGSYPVRMATLRSVYMDLADDLGESGFKWIFAVNLHGAPPHNRAMDDAALYFNDTFHGRMVNLTGLVRVAGAVPKDLFTDSQRAAEGMSVHADADEHSRVLFLRPGLVPPTVRTAPEVVGHNMDDLVTLAQAKGWPGYFGTPSIANAAAGSRAMIAISQAAVETALDILNGAPDSDLPRVADLARDPAFKQLVDQTLEHDLSAEQRQAAWLAKHN
jgi:creatinine amidohydrolase/Fe(II)-dependent formamide hydrolase-like protein